MIVVVILAYLYSTVQYSTISCLYINSSLLQNKLNLMKRTKVSMFEVLCTFASFNFIKKVFLNLAQSKKYDAGVLKYLLSIRRQYLQLSQSRETNWGRTCT